MASGNQAERHQQVRKGPPATYIRYYLLVYNVISCLAWFYILGIVCYHLASGYWSPLSVRVRAQVNSFLRAFSPTAPSRFTSMAFNSVLPEILHPIVDQAASLYKAVGWQTKIVQTGAVLELLHVAFGWVRSPMTSTAMQVASRLVLVWGIASTFDQAQENPLYASMVLAWAITEVIRYAYYAFSLLSVNSTYLTYLRYSLFYVLYPMGAGSEAFVMFSTLPSFQTTPRSTVPVKDAWIATPWPVIRLALFILWWPGLWIMYNHMRVQRRKVIGGFSGRGRTLKSD